MTTDFQTLLAPAFAALRQGNLPDARRLTDVALAQAPDVPQLLSFAGMLACQAGDFQTAVGHLRRAVKLWPDDLATRINLVMALMDIGAPVEAQEVAAAGPREPRLVRLLAYLRQESGAFAEAEADYGFVLEADPQDWESWNNLGNVRGTLGKLDAAMDAFDRAIAINPRSPAAYVNATKLLTPTDRTEARLRIMRAAARQCPDDVDVQTELGLAESAARNFPAAENAFRAAISLAEGFTPAFLELGLMLENLNSIDELQALVAHGAGRAGDNGETGFLKAWVLRRSGDYEAALELAKATPDTVSPVRRAQLVAELEDRLGHAAQAFASFGEMNRAAIAQFPAPEGESDYLEEVQSISASLDEKAVAQWNSDRPSGPEPSPLFIVGFPRSGTTLLDTLMMNLPRYAVQEEQPMLAHAQQAMAHPAGAGALDGAALDELRTRYFEALAMVADPAPDQIVVDKHPLHMAKMPLVHRLFPDARIIMVERHPFDVVLSCYMANFHPNRAMRHFATLEGAARLYDAVFECWTRAQALLPLNVHTIRYERMVDDLESEMRPLLAFLGEAWTDNVLDNTGSAARRDHIRTASYAQVGQPIYRQAAGRWERYRDQLAPVIPILAPWAERMGYPV